MKNWWIIHTRWTWIYAFKNMQREHQKMMSDFFWSFQTTSSPLLKSDIIYGRPQTVNYWILPSILLVYFSTMLSASSFSIPSSFLMTFNCSWRRYFLWTDLTLSSTSFPIFCCNLLNSYSFLSKAKAKYSLLGISFSDKTSTRSLVSPKNSKKNELWNMFLNFN